MSNPDDTPAVEPSKGIPVFGAWCRHRGNFRRDNEDSLRLVALDAADPDASVPDRGTGESPTSGRGLVAVVCDGVGGGAAGEVASAIAVEAFLAHLRMRVGEASEVGDVEESLREAWMRDAVSAAHEAILAAVAEDRSLEGMGTTLTGVWLVGDRLHLAQVGDSRLYRLKRGRIEQLSEDQSLVGRLRRDGRLSEEQARRHPLRNIVDQVVGGSERGVNPTISSLPVSPGEEFLLCSDGLTDAMPDRILEKEWVANLDRVPGDVADHLIDRVLEIAGRDNVSVILLRPFAPRASRIRAWTARGARLLRQALRRPEPAVTDEAPDEALPGNDSGDESDSVRP